MIRHMITMPHPLDHKESENCVREWGQGGVTREYVRLPQVYRSHLEIEDCEGETGS